MSFTGEAKSLIQQLLESAEGKGGWTSMRSQTGSRSMGGGHATVEENHQKEGGRPTITSSSSTSSLHTAMMGLFKNLKLKWQFRSELRTLDATAGTGAAWKRGELKKTSGISLCPSTTAPQTLSGVYSALGTNPWDTAELAPSPTLLPAQHPVPGAQLHKSWDTPGHSQKMPETPPSAKKRRDAPQSQLHWCHSKKVTASLTVIGNQIWSP